MKFLVYFSAVVSILAWQNSSAEQLKCQKGWKRFGDMSHMLEIKVVSGKPESVSYTGSTKLREDSLAYNCFFDANPKDKTIVWKDSGSRVQIVGMAEKDTPDKLSLDYTAKRFTLNFEEFNHRYHCGQAAEPPKSITLIKGQETCEVVE